MNSFFSTCKVWIGQNEAELLYQLIVIFTVLASMNFLMWVLAKLMQRHFAKKRSIWPQAFFSSIRLPAGIFIWIAGLSYCLLVLDISSLSNIGYHINKIAFISCFLWMTLRMINFVEKIYSDDSYAKSKQQRDTIYTIARFTKVALTILGTLVGLQAVGISVSGLIAFGGVGAAGIAFAAKDLLGNFFGGLMVFFNRPFSVGDWIRSPDRQIEGVVEDIGWLITRIRTSDKRPLYVPNGIFSSIAIENPQRMLNRQIKQTISMRYEDAAKIMTITAEIKNMLKHHPEIDSRQTTIVDLVSFGSSSLDMLISAYTKTIDLEKFQDIQQEIFLKIIDIIVQHGAQCPSSTNTIQLTSDSVLAVRNEKD